VNKKVCCELLKKDAVVDVSEPASKGEWETIDNGKLLTYTAKHVVARSKVTQNTLVVLMCI
jgi:hypothetical protein